MKTRKKRRLTVVIFGSTGNLTRIKLLPALESLARDRLSEDNFTIVAVGRRDLDDRGYYDLMADDLPGGELRGKIKYFQGEIGRKGGIAGLAGFLRRRHLAETDLIFYVATPPEFFVPLAAEIAALDLPGARRFSRRVVFEKPLGKSLSSATKMMNAIFAYFQRDQVILIDHYLGKEVIQNLLVIRFLNQIYEAALRREYVRNIQITVSESAGIEDRGQYYDDAGVIRDMVQSHILQIAAFLTMTHPHPMTVEEILREKLKALKSLHLPLPLGENIVLGQYRGYRREKHVAPGSITPTYVALKLCSRRGPLRNVPIFIRTGKALKRQYARIVIELKPKPDILTGRILAGNKIVLTIQPEARIMIYFNHKVPGLSLRVQEVCHSFCRDESFTQTPRHSYERLLYEILLDHHLLFVSPEEI
ncbi:MAG: glucose-6-phosphate dehydrogenase, partial [Candidatus Auribacterota bacterium]|nr:glucose-6-phosphate dehydrogenase [Candidatus Auribacterota bacterium]